MMQQFATSSSKLAVSALSMDMNHAEAYSKDTRNTFGESRNAFEKAIADAEQSAFVKASDFATGSEVFQKQVFQQPVIKEPVISDDISKETSNNINNDTNNEISKDISEVAQQKLDGKDTSTVEDAKQRKLEETSVAVIDKQSGSNSIDTTAKIQDEAVNDLFVTESDPAIDMQSKSLDTDKQSQGFESSTNEFDYINFVTQIQILNDEVLEDSALVTDGISENEQSLDLANISLTEGELQIILDAQQAGVDLKDMMTEEQLVKLSDAINKMLSQFHAQNNSDTPEIGQSDTLKDVDLLDLELLSTLLTQSTNNSLEDLKPMQAEVLLDLPVKPNNDRKVDFKEASSVAAELATEKVDGGRVLETKLEFQQGLSAGAKEVEIVSEMQSQASKQALSITDAEAQIKQATEEEVSAAPSSIIQNLKSSIEPNNMPAAISDKDIPAVADVAVKPQPKVANDDSFDVTKQLAMLDERSQTNILENIKSRVEKFVADLAGNSSKGSEFVAAMQVGLKEFKEQLQSGREPGIDLKALISDAMFKANVEIPAQTQTKVDAALNQFTGLMNIANLVNQSSQAQAHQLFGLTETQMIKESNALHTEGTKLAQQTPTNFDKAVNIFKPEGQQHLAEKVRWMVNGRNPAAEIRFDPPELGSMQIKINMTSDTAAVSFTVQSASAKDALDQALPKLRDMLQEQGIELGQSSVEQQASGQSEQRNEQRSSGQAVGSGQLADGIHDDEVNSPMVFEQRITGGSLGGIDFYA